MSIFRDAGIYVLVDLDLNRDIYTDSSRWDINIYTWTTTVVDQLASFPNILGFIVAQVYHERLNAPPSSVAFVKAAARDIKYYIRSQNYRQIPVGVRGRNSDNYDAAATYLTCGNSTAETIDFWSLWDFSWCGDGDDSDYETVTSSHQKYNIPSFIYYGCNSIRPRNFTEVGAIYGTQMLAVWSGGIVQKWLEDYEDLGQSF
jgi:1,3-beta-glucanosyltransferase GAS1